MAKERVGQRHRRTTGQNVTLIPLRASGEFRGHRRVTALHDHSPLTHSRDRVFILCGMAEEPTWPGAEPSVTSSWPAIRRTVCANEDGPAPSWTSAETTSWSSERRDRPARRWKHRAETRKADDPGIPVPCQPRAVTSNRSSMSCASSPSGPLMPRSLKRVPVEQFAHALQRHQGLLRRRREPLAQRGRLGGDVDERGRPSPDPILHGTVGQPRDDSRPWENTSSSDRGSAAARRSR